MEVRHRSCSHRLRPTARGLLLMVVVLAITSSLSAACGGSQDPLVGRWKAISTAGPRTDGTLFHRRSTVEFFENGALDIEGRSAKWNWPADDRLRIEFPGEAYVLEAVFDRDELIVRDRGFGGNTVITFARDLSRKPPPDR